MHRPPRADRGSDPSGSSRLALLCALGGSLLLHLGLAALVGAEWLPARRRAPAPPPTPPVVRFELVPTPPSAATETPPPDARFASNRNTRAQDLAPPDAAPRIDSPLTTGTSPSHDLRTPGPRSPAASLRPPPAPPRAPAAPPAARATPETRRRPIAAGDEATRLEPEAPDAGSAATTTPASASPPTPRAAAGGGRITRATPQPEELANARARGEFSYAATQRLFADYFLRLRDRVELAWNLLLTKEFLRLGPSEVTIEFRVHPDGSVGEVEIGPGQGSRDFPLLCDLAIRNASPFDPVPYDDVPDLPPDVRGLPLRVRITFNYR